MVIFDDKVIRCSKIVHYFITKQRRMPFWHELVFTADMYNFHSSEVAKSCCNTIRESEYLCNILKVKKCLLKKNSYYTKQSMFLLMLLKLLFI